MRRTFLIGALMALLTTLAWGQQGNTAVGVNLGYATADGYNAFRLGDRLAVLLTQSDRDVRKTRLSVPGYERVELDSVSGDVSLEGDTIVLPRHALAVVTYRKKKP